MLTYPWHTDLTWMVMWTFNACSFAIFSFLVIMKIIININFYFQKVHIAFSLLVDYSKDCSCGHLSELLDSDNSSFISYCCYCIYHHKSFVHPFELFYKHFIWKHFEQCTSWQNQSQSDIVIIIFIVIAHLLGFDFCTISFLLLTFGFFVVLHALSQFKKSSFIVCYYTMPVSLVLVKFVACYKNYSNCCCVDKTVL